MPSRRNAVAAAAAAVAATAATSAMAATPGGSEIVGSSSVSGMMLFNSAPGKVVILDKTEGNAARINGHPAWGEEWDTQKRTSRLMNVVTNTFCAGGMSLGNGTWAVFGGNENVGPGGNSTTPRFSTTAPYYDGDGGAAARFYTPNSQNTSDWDDGNHYMKRRRWYPTVEALADGTLWVGGGEDYGGYVADEGQNQPNFEYWPPRGDAINMDFLTQTLPMNLYPLAWLMASGLLFVQAGQDAILYNLDTNSVAKGLPSTTGPMKVYPASAGVAMLPMTPANNYTQEVLFCGGVQRPLNEWGNGAGPLYNPLPIAASKVCERITPEASNPTWEQDDDLINGRSMGTFVYLPDGKLWFGQGVRMGTGGYSGQNYNKNLGISLGDQPDFQPMLYDPTAPKGSRFSTDGLSPMQVQRMYHSTAILLEDGSVLTAGSNPNADVSFDNPANYTNTEYRLEQWYPTWYNEARPTQPNVTQIAYGGGSFDVALSGSDLSNNITNIKTAKMVVIRPGFATHGVNFGQRYLELNSTYTANQDGSVGGTLHVANMPPNANIFQPGPAMAFLVVNGIPSIGQHVMIGTGQLGDQRVSDATSLPASQDPPAPKTSNGGGSGSGSSSGGTQSGQSSGAVGTSAGVVASLALAAVASALVAFA
ncbi:DUF1929-domain-containing protein [Moesziomyces antarcticus]|uniref:Probable glyoxaloxidase 3 n=1 Tax=Pseudozyma antarctica TaxID=84753 RepID=A0A5C3FI95_PSEA2|nr:DUF1929-domain-containing protein [Moesziomyces antarcticus]GAK63053.1 DUF1929-domain-containing protein [Moesziomyces antarcticus]SPO43465.1 probable glyoxaloxidase 3 [Moesziomyces antarcticus]